MDAHRGLEPGMGRARHSARADLGRSVLFPVRDAQRTARPTERFMVMIWMCLLNPEILFALSSRASASSVSLFPRERMRDITSDCFVLAQTTVLANNFVNNKNNFVFS